MEDHLFAVSRFARRLTKKLQMEEIGALLGLLHDLGKYSESFQSYLKKMQPCEDTEPDESERGSVDHSTAGAQVIWNALHGKDAKKTLVAEILSLCIASHHSGLIDCIEPDGRKRLELRMKKADADAHTSEAWNSAAMEIRVEAQRLLDSPSVAQSLGPFFARLADLDREPAIASFKKGLLVRFLFSCLIDADRTDTADSEKPQKAAARQHGAYEDWRTLSSRLESELVKFTGDSRVSELRRQIALDALAASARSRGISH